MKPNAITDRLENTDRGVSPVIGVILMVAITVILAAVIGTFVLDLGQSAGNSAPSASLTVNADTATNSFEISHKGGDTLQSENTRIQITNESTGDSVSWDPANSSTLGVGDTANASVGTEQLFFGSDVVYGPGDVTSDVDAVNSGFQYSVQLIDTESQRVIFETTVTA